jgi:N utilization substance protein B
MLSRRNIRIKVMQTIYAHNSGAYQTVLVAEKALLKSVQNAYNAALYNLYIIRETALYARKEAKMRSEKKLPSKEDLVFSSKFADNTLIAELEHNVTFNELVKENKIALHDSDDLIKKFFRALLQKEEYAKYMAKATPTPEEDRAVVAFIFNKMMLADENYVQQLEELFPNWIDDQASVNFRLNQILNETDLSVELGKRNNFRTDKEDEDFGVDLFHRTVSNDEDFNQLVSPKLQNWDMDRIASLDMILIKMALCELLFFNNIPIKVSINEYIDISKIYSTPKSKDFINGILDKLMNQLKEEGKIKKQGRGLMG